MGIENNTREIEVQNQELQRANREQIEQAHNELGKALDDLDTLDNDAELNETDSIEDTKAQDDISSHLDGNSIIEDEPSEPLENVKNQIYNEVENNDFSINDVNQAVDAKEAYEADICDIQGNEAEQNPDASFKKDEADIVNLNEIRSKFDSENFTVEKSYDVCASKETRELAAKGNSELVPMGEDTNNHPEASETYTKEEAARLKAERDEIKHPDEKTVMQKIIGVDTGKIEEDLKGYLNPKNNVSGKKTDAQVFGFVAKAEDSTPFTSTPEECYVNLRTDYPGTPYKDPKQPVYVLRYTDGTKYEIPYGEQFGGNCKEGAPCTLNGYTGSSEHLVPEYTVKKDENGNGAIITDGKIYRVSPDEPETAVAEFDEDYKKFVLCK